LIEKGERNEETVKTKTDGYTIHIPFQFRVLFPSVLLDKRTVLPSDICNWGRSFRSLILQSKKTIFLPEISLPYGISRRSSRKCLYDGRSSLVKGLECENLWEN
jgi:hypothetical protein